MVVAIIIIAVLLAALGGSYPPSVRRLLEQDLDRLGIDDPDKRRRLKGGAFHDLDRRIVDGLRRNMERRLSSRGWTPPCSDEPLFTGGPVLAPESVEQKVLRWARLRADFSARDVQRAFSWFESAADVKACLRGLTAQGVLERLPTSRPKGARGRMPSPRYRAVPIPDEQSRVPVTGEPQELVWPDPVETELDWPVED